MTRYLLAIPLSLTIIVSPDAQVLLGNGMGMVGWFFPPCLVLVAFFHLLTLRAYADIYGGGSGGGSEYAFLRTIFGAWLPLTTSLASRLVFMLCAATVALVTAGFLFNEVFVYWFANFAFAFLLLGLVLLIQLGGWDRAVKIQGFLVAFVLTILVFFVAAGFWQNAPPQPAGHVEFQGRGLLFAFLMVVGFEFAFVAKSEPPPIAVIATVLMGVILLLAVWGVVMFIAVGPDRLAQSFIPHMTGARLVLGQPGRILMGAALIAGAAALVNGLLLVLRRQLAEMIPEAWLPHSAGRKRWLAGFGIVALAAAPALMMASGAAGEDVIDLYARAALVIWLGHYSLVHFAVAVSSSARQVLHVLAGMILIGSGVALGVTEPEPFVFLESVAMIMLSVGVVSLFITKMGQWKPKGG